VAAVSEGLGTPTDPYGLGDVGALADTFNVNRGPVEFNGENRKQHFAAGAASARGGAKPPVHPPASTATPLKVAAYGIGKAFKMKGF
jgi:hypothetical protein